ncbi:endonuclease/exonuclease/phosphatase family protein [Roseimarinus sediminis]|uniref:endonuclease/exonuclease/phosphatase family protein n=1 Tax=Roseimarinus sediminis TaxID=1610899 RepID=UPI003D19D81D
MRKLVKYLLLSLNLLLVFLLAACYFVPGINPGSFWWPSLLGLAYPYLLLLNLSFIVFWLIVSWRYLFLSLLCVGAGAGMHAQYFQLMGKHSPAEDGIRVLSYNVMSFYSFLEEKEDKPDILDFIAMQDADIICLQETKLQKTGVLNPVRLKTKFPGIKHVQLAHQSQWSGPVTFTRFPIVNMGEIRFEGSNNMVIYTDVYTGEDTLRIYNCHLQSFGIRTEEYSIIDSLDFRNEQLNEVKLLGLKLRDANRRRAAQVVELKEHIDACRYPLIVCGDFNDTPISYTYNTISSKLNDAFVAAGQGISNTYRGKLPPYRIDYILYSNEFEAVSYERHRAEYSDHFPVSAVLKRK